MCSTLYVKLYEFLYIHYHFLCSVRFYVPFNYTLLLRSIQPSDSEVQADTDEVPSSPSSAVVPEDPATGDAEPEEHTEQPELTGEGEDKLTGNESIPTDDDH